MRTITVKGIGAVSVKPDLIVLRLSMETAEYEYDAAMKAAAEKIDFLNKALEAAGFEKKSAKTADFRVRADYDRLKGFHLYPGCSRAIIRPEFVKAVRYGTDETTKRTEK